MFNTTQFKAKLNTVRRRNKKMTMTSDEVIEQLESLAMDQALSAEQEQDIFAKDVYSIDCGIKAIKVLDELLNLLEEKRQNAIDEKVHWEIRKYIPCHYTDEELNSAIEKALEDSITYTDCIETLKNLRGKDYE